MAQTIPVSQIVTVNPSVVVAGGNPLSLNAIFVDQNTTIPVTSLLSFGSSDEVAAYFGSNSTQKALADNYFLGFDTSTKKPGTLFFGGYALLARSAFLRGQSLAGVTLAQLQAISGTLIVTVDGVTKTAAALNLSAASSFSNAATLIATALTLTPATCTWDAATSRFVITSSTTGVTSTMTQATGTTAAALGLAAGILSQGVAIDTPASAMDRIKTQEQNWGTWMTTFEPNLADKTAFAVWNNAQANRYAYVAWDTDTGYATPNNGAVFGTIVDIANYEGVVVVYNTAAIAAFTCGYAGSIDFQATNGRATAAFKSQTGLATSVGTLALANAVLSNNASYYGLYQAPGAGNIYSILYDGGMDGSKFRWLDTYLNQIYLNAQLQLAIFVGLQQNNSTPYNSQGETFIRSWCADPITEALNNGSIRVGVPLSAAQSAAIAAQAGFDITTQLETQGYYLQILPATAPVRQARQSPPVKLWYMDGGAIQQITLASIAVL
jgi:Protein of unknown function (DUF3383).